MKNIIKNYMAYQTQMRKIKEYIGSSEKANTEYRN